MKRHLPQKIKALVLDFDGVFTDNRVIVFENGQEAVICNRSDTYGLDIIKKSGIQIMVLSGEKNHVVKSRCKKLNLQCIAGMKDKESAFLKWIKIRKIDIKDTIYVGNDSNDVGCLKLVGCGIAVKDASAEARKAAHIILKHKGGNGAVREVFQMVLTHLGLK